MNGNFFKDAFHPHTFLVVPVNRYVIRNLNSSFSLAVASSCFVAFDRISGHVFPSIFIRVYNTLGTYCPNFKKIMEKIISGIGRNGLFISRSTLSEDVQKC